LQEQGIDSYEDLKRKAAAASNEFESLSDKIKDADKKLKDIAELQKQIGTYGKTRGVFDAYKRSGYDRAFYDANAADMILHRAAKKFFDAQGFKTKLPSINSLKQEYAATLAGKKKLYGDYHRLRDSSKELAVAKANADRLLGITPIAQSSDVPHTTHRRGTHEL
jgi:predicted  nucleic acid-binding Zn-ribbon protein